MKRIRTNIPLAILLKTAAIGVVAATPILFIAQARVRRACGFSFFGERERFCTAQQLWTWLPAFVQGATWLVAIALIFSVVAAIVTRYDPGS